MRARVAMNSCLMLAILAAAGVASAERATYGGSHPIPEGRAGRFCYIDVTHVHTYGPAQRDDFQKSSGSLQFVGDPMAHGYEGPVFAYEGPHPLAFENHRLDFENHAAADPEARACALSGSHYHLKPPRNPERYQDIEGTLRFGPAERRSHRSKPKKVRQARRRVRHDRSPIAAPPTFATTPAPVARNDAKPPSLPQAEPAKSRDPFRSWMNRRRGQ